MAPAYRTEYQTKYATKSLKVRPLMPGDRFRDVSASVDTAIVGAGIVGLATAHALCRDGAGSVALFDRGMPGSGDSGRSFSMVRRHYSNAVTARLAIDGSRTIRHWSDEVGVADAGFVRCGYLLTVPPALVDACRSNVALLQSLGLDTRYLDVGELQDVEPELSLEGVAGAAYEPDGGFADAQKMCLGWFAAAAARGLRHHLGRTVAAVRVEAGRAVGVETADGFVPAGPGRAGRRRLGERSPAASRRRAADRAAPAAGADRAARDPGRPASLRGLLGRGDERGRPARPGPAVLRRRLRRRGPARARGRLRPRPLGRLRGRRSARPATRGIPRLADFELVRGFAGPYDITPDWNPIIGPCPGIDGLYLAVGWSGHGFKLAPAVGEVVAAEVTGRTPPIDVERAPARAVRGGPAAAALLRAGRRA